MTGSAVPPRARSGTALGLLRGVAAGRLLLQRCAECATVQYPPRDACRACLGDDLQWTEVESGGEVLASTSVRASTEDYFRERAPWPVGLIHADCGPQLVAHLSISARAGQRVRIEPVADPGGRPVLVALPEQDTGPGAGSAPPAGFDNAVEGRTVRVTDPESSLGAAVVEALRARGAGTIVRGEREGESDATETVDLILDTRP